MFQTHTSYSHIQTVSQFLENLLFLQFCEIKLLELSAVHLLQLGIHGPYKAH